MEELVARAKKGENDAFLKLVEGRLGVLYRIAFSYFKNRDDAADAVQDSILISYKNIKRLKSSSSFYSWMTAILVNRCREKLRRAGRFIFEEYSEESFYPKDEYSSVDASIDMLSYLQRLDGKYREVITLKYFGDHTIKEIAEILGIPEGTVKSRINYGLNKLKFFMEVKADGM